MNNHQKSTFYPLGNLFSGIQQSFRRVKLDIGNRSYLYQGL
ncbi:hypothetical protein THERMOT_192 [Bathymodiolus thermophilus thioautotrophic gill symbiont]|uniref:Uncharacterized protein n=1 Tax=Bathymodiolus thermophilus thioautotrophic gill symbiont TaxID=2360 RepID=A0A8H8XFK2_9GAMM|nr:hypothetical protein [Bathymodiolus thermophilus thioautotrophic gill symbiont]CAB5494877.1 hypothetical protein THERMOT_192 [Bathymodiolus thermophilus thioautotrophic gill symbiont]CAB5501903.1 hypothetical protein THERMOS_1476 [Bathymodiolus thermophilus thioautotrophic gill symbiont]